MGEDPYKVTIIDGKGYVSISVAKQLMGVASAKELRSHGASTLRINDGQPLWSVDWLVSLARCPRPGGSKLNPNREWLEQYDAGWLDRDPRPRHALDAARLAIEPRSSELESSSRLPLLTKLAPPPKDAADRPVDWGTIESTVGVEYPASFKEFVDVYSNYVWFDAVWPLCPYKDSAAEFKQRLDSVFKSSFERSTEHREVGVLRAPHFSERSGWLPFLSGWDGYDYAWVIDGPPNEWYVIETYHGHRATVLPPISITEMFVGWLLGERLMQEVWGDVDEFREHSSDRLAKPFGRCSP